MKYIYTILFVLIFSFSFIRPQIPNAGFENWANGDPVGWFTLDYFGDAVSQSSDSHSGSSAAKMQIIDFMGSPIPPLLITGTFGVSERFGSLTGYFKFMPLNTNQAFSVAVLMSKGASNYIGGGAIEIFQTTSSYTQFIVPIEYYGQEIPDSAYIQIVVEDTTEIGGGIGSYAIIDDLSFAGPTDVNNNQVVVNTYKLEQNFPNPFNPSTKISWQLPVGSQTTLTVFDFLGKEVATLVDEYKSAGIYESTFDASGLTSGIYFYRLQAGDFVQTKKMILLK